MLEFEALSEIYDKNIFHYKLLNDNSEVKGEFIAYYKIDEVKSVNIIGNNYSFRIVHLPPISLKFNLNLIVENIEPELALSCSWLPRSCLSILEDQLKQILKDNSDGRFWMCFEYLENKSIDILAECENQDIINVNINNIFPFDNEESVADRLRMLRSFNDDRDISVFENFIIECAVCFSMKRGNESAKFSACSHIVCNVCLANHFNTRISMGFLNLSCAVCDKDLEYEEVRRVMDSQSFERWDSLSFNDFVKTLDDHYPCPRCQTVIPTIPDDGYGFCKSCKHTFCLDCKEIFNGPKCCRNKTEENEILNQQRVINRVFHTQPNKRKTNKELRLKKKEMTLGENILHCPGCDIPYEKNGGCNHLTCTYCKQHFCFLCNKIINSAHPYSHFTKKCTLFMVPPRR